MGQVIETRDAISPPRSPSPSPSGREGWDGPTRTSRPDAQKRHTSAMWGGAATEHLVRDGVTTGEQQRSLVGRVLHQRFTIVDVIGHGGMGVVYSAVDTVLDRAVVVKVVGPHAGSPLGGARLVREAQLVCRVQHPSIVTVFDLGILDDREPFIVMERLEGRDLAQILADGGALSIETVADLIDPIADALDALHQAGIVHRDVKPENLFVLGARLEKPRVKLIDFGLAILDSTAMARLTRDGQIVGTAEYIAPELIRGGTPTPASDVYALACTVFHLLTGRLPFDGTGLDLLASKVSEAPKPLGDVLPGADADLERLMARALALDPAARPAVTELATALRAASDRARGRVAVPSRPSVELLEEMRASSHPPRRDDPTAPVRRTPPRLPSVVGPELEETARRATVAAVLACLASFATLAATVLDRWIS